MTSKINSFKSKRRGPNLRRVKGNVRNVQRRQLLFKLVAGVWFCVFAILFFQRTGNDNDYDESEQSRFLARLQRRAGLRKNQMPNTESMKIKTMKQEQPILDRIMEGSAHLVDIRVNPSEYFSKGKDVSYSGVSGFFCTIDWSLHKYDPAAHPMFRFLVKKSPDCENPVKVNFKEVVDKVKEFDKTNNSKDVHVMKPKGFVFHESRCGSTLVANSLAAMDPSKNRVYSESGPPLTALKSCGHHKDDCYAAQLFRDVVYMMGRTNDEKEQNLFFKIQSIGTKFTSVVQEAFPEVPWIFVYRDPVQVMMSHLKNGPTSANCVRQLSIPPTKMNSILKEKGLDNAMRLTPEQQCALHLSTLCESAVSSLQLSTATGKAVNYDLLPDILSDSIIPTHFGVPLSSADKARITKISGTYSKGRNEKRDWKEDSSQKEKNASEEVKAAADLFLSQYVDALEKLS